MLLNHENYEIVKNNTNQRISTFEVTIMDKDKKYYKFKWQVEKYEVDGFLKNCWLTTAVSQPHADGFIYLMKKPSFPVRIAILMAILCIPPIGATQIDGTILDKRWG